MVKATLKECRPITEQGNLILFNLVEIINWDFIQDPDVDSNKKFETFTSLSVQSPNVVPYLTVTMPCISVHVSDDLQIIHLQTSGGLIEKRDDILPEYVPGGNWRAPGVGPRVALHGEGVHHEQQQQQRSTCHGTCTRVASHPAGWTPDSRLFPPRRRAMRSVRNAAARIRTHGTDDARVATVAAALTAGCFGPDPAHVAGTGRRHQDLAGRKGAATRRFGILAGLDSMPARTTGRYIVYYTSAGLYINRNYVCVNQSSVRLGSPSQLAAAALVVCYIRYKMVLSMDRWVGKVAMVTGPSSGIGEAIAERLVERGMKRTSGKKGKFYPMKGDVSKEEDILSVFKWTRENLGPLHVLVNNAGIVCQSGIQDGKTEDWLQTINVNVVGLCIATREALKDMTEHKIDGHIFNINSIAGHYIMGYPKVEIYTASKHAVTTLTESMRKQMAMQKLKIRFTSISPGLVDTEIPAAARNNTSEAAAEIIKNAPILKSEDIADALEYALSTPPHVQSLNLFFLPLLVRNGAIYGQMDWEGGCRYGSKCRYRRSDSRKAG
nr:unnamed protein product [Callosobruchus analis]